VETDGQRLPSDNEAGREVLDISRHETKKLDGVRYLDKTVKANNKGLVVQED
jgi:hypothetical protein